MRFPFLTRGHHEDVVALYEQRLTDAENRIVRAEADRAEVLNKLLRLSFGNDGEDHPASQAEEEQPEPYGEVARAVRATGSRRWSTLRRRIERDNANLFGMRQRGQEPDPAMAAVTSMDQAFEEGKRTVSS